MASSDLGISIKPSSRADAAVAPPLTATDIERMVSGLPTWLLSHIVGFLLAKQVRWQPYHRRSRAWQWLGELRRAWTWLLDERQVTGLADLSRGDLNAYLTHCHERELSSGTVNHFLSTLQKLMGHRHLDTTMLYTKVYDQTLQGDYTAAMARLQARSESSLDWDLWGPAIEAAFQTKAETVAAPELSTVVNCM